MAENVRFYLVLRNLEATLVYNIQKLHLNEQFNMARSTLDSFGIAFGGMQRGAVLLRLNRSRASQYKQHTYLMNKRSAEYYCCWLQTKRPGVLHDFFPESRIFRIFDNINIKLFTSFYICSNLTTSM